MNAARRTVIAEIRSTSGCTGKEAYEASKDAGLMAEWIRVSIRDQQPNGRAKVNPRKWDWRGRLRVIQKAAAIQEAKAIKIRAKKNRKANMIRELMAKGMDIKKAIRIARKKHD